MAVVRVSLIVRYFVTTRRMVDYFLSENPRLSAQHPFELTSDSNGLGIVGFAKGTDADLFDTFFS